MKRAVTNTIFTMISVFGFVIMVGGDADTPIELFFIMLFGLGMMAAGLLGLVISHMEGGK